jgi:hypothetical protein
MVLRSHDLLLCFDGGIPFSATSTMQNDVSLTAYEQARNKRPEGRSLLVLSRGSDGDIDGNVRAVIGQIDLFTGNQPAKIGQVCILGRSNGCSLALGVAAKLQTLGVPEMTFVGLSDVTMFPSGRKPPIALIGTLTPNTDPTTTAAKSPNFVQKKLGSFQQPVPDGAIPTITLATVIRAAQGTVNHFQIKGNHMKYAPSVDRWIWFSDMDDGEVHGKIDSFQTNTNFDDVTGSSDLDLHIDLNTKQHWKELAAKASAALAKIP